MTNKRVPLNPELIIQRCREKHGDKYEYLPFEYVPGVNKIHDTFQVRCKEHDLIFTPTIANHMHKGSGCPVCGKRQAAMNTRKGKIHFIKLATDIHGNLYDYSKWEDVDNMSTEKVTIICKDHGEFEQTPNDHIGKKAGCPTCGRNRSITKHTDYMRSHLDDEAKLLLENKEWMYEQHITNKRSLSCIASQLSTTGLTVSNQLRRLEVPIQYNHDGRSVGEKQLFEFISSICPDAVSSDRTIIAPKELDIVIPSHKIAIEYCGLYWHSEVHKAANYHKEKMELANAAGYRVLTIFEDEWKSSATHVKAKLAHLLGQTSERVYARKCKIVSVSTEDKSAFLDKHHIQGNGPSSIQFGLEYEGSLVAVIAFIAKTGGVYTLNRYATSKSIPGGFSKLLKHSISNLPHLQQIETFADLRWSEGDLYEATGFTKEYTIPPDYYWTDGISRWHKFGFRHSLLQSKLEHYDETLTESQNCHNHGLYRLYDCGKIKYIMPFQ